MLRRFLAALPFLLPATAGMADRLELDGGDRFVYQTVVYDARPYDTGGEAIGFSRWSSEVVASDTDTIALREDWPMTGTLISTLLTLDRDYREVKREHGKCRTENEPPTDLYRAPLALGQSWSQAVDVTEYCQHDTLVTTPRVHCETVSRVVGEGEHTVGALQLATVRIDRLAICGAPGDSLAGQLFITYTHDNFCGSLHVSCGSESRQVWLPAGTWSDELLQAYRDEPEQQRWRTRMVITLVDVTLQ